MSIVADHLVKIGDIDADICKCPCHDKGQHMMHIAPCCQQCKYCGANIKFFAIDSHEAKCFKNPNFGRDSKKEGDS